MQYIFFSQWTKRYLKILIREVVFIVCPPLRCCYVNMFLLINNCSNLFFSYNGMPFLYAILYFSRTSISISAALCQYNFCLFANIVASGQDECFCATFVCIGIHVSLFTQQCYLKLRHMWSSERARTSVSPWICQYPSESFLILETIAYANI